jgi:hypothetical protein
MPTLLDLQRNFAAAMTGGDPGAIAAAVVADAPGAAARLQIYRNHFSVTLVEALEATYPVLRRLVGAEYFTRAARRFIRTAPPAGPCLFEYGQAFPDHIAQEPGAAPLVYLRDVGRLEWAVNAAYHAADAPRLAATALADLPVARLLEVRLTLQPSCRLVSSPYPIDRIWKVNQSCGGGDGETVDLAAGGVRLFVYREREEVGWQKLAAGEFAFVRALAVGANLQEAAAAAAEIGNGFDIPAFVAACLDAGVFSAFTLPPS